MDDADLLMMAKQENRILTNDKDFGELVFLQKKLSLGILLLRVKGQSTKEEDIRSTLLYAAKCLSRKEVFAA